MEISNTSYISLESVAELSRDLSKGLLSLLHYVNRLESGGTTRREAKTMRMTDMSQSPSRNYRAIQAKDYFPYYTTEKDMRKIVESHPSLKEYKMVDLVLRYPAQATPIVAKAMREIGTSPPC